MSEVDQTIKDVAVLPRKTLTELINETDASIYYTLKNSIYPGARDESIAMVIAACKARNYPILAKCYHIVPMSVKDAQTDKYVWRDVIMMGINAYRIEADRATTYLGLSEPEYGPMIKENLGGKIIQYPEWCKIVATKVLSNGKTAVFPAIEYWKENYATKGKDSQEPNAMWTKRPRAQLAKCTEAQALRRAFPDILGSNITYEEMEGKEFEKEAKGERVDLTADAPTQEFISEEQIRLLAEKITATNSDLIELCKYFKIGCLEELPLKSFDRLLGMLNHKANKSKPVLNPGFEAAEPTPVEDDLDL